VKFTIRTALIAVLLTASAVFASCADASPLNPRIAATHGVSSATLTVTNESALMETYAGVRVSYEWQAEHAGQWSPVPGARRRSLKLSTQAPNPIRVLVTITGRHGRVELYSDVSAPAHTVDRALPIKATTPVPAAYVPESWSGPNPPQNCESIADGVGDEAGVVAADSCGASLEGLAPLPLPENWSQLSDIQRGFVMINLERIERGETPVIGESSTLDGYAMDGAIKDTDPDPPDSADWLGSNWYGGTDQEDAITGYLYTDGPGGDNEACTGNEHWGCWGHRDNILGNSTRDDLDVGLADGPNGDSTQVVGYGYHDLNFTWSGELAAGYPEGPPTSFQLTTPTITSIIATSRTISFSGTNLDTVAVVYFANVKGNGQWSCVSSSNCSMTVPTNLQANTTYGVTMLNAAGLSSPSPAVTYVSRP
jgi:hypothetical protein